jgi:hypothetical protein
VAWEILTGKIPVGGSVNGVQPGIPMDFSLYGEGRYPVSLPAPLLPGNPIETLGERDMYYDLLQQEMVSLDLLGANIVRGIKRSGNPSVVNIVTWHKSGLQDNLRGGEIDYAAHVLNYLGASATALGFPEDTIPREPGPVNVYNDGELDALRDLQTNNRGLYESIIYMLPK